MAVVESLEVFKVSESGKMTLDSRLLVVQVVLKKHLEPRPEQMTRASSQYQKKLREFIQY